MLVIFLFFLACAVAAFAFGWYGLDPIATLEKLSPEPPPKPIEGLLACGKCYWLPHKAGRSPLEEIWLNPLCEEHHRFAWKPWSQLKAEMGWLDEEGNFSPPAE